MSNLNPVLVEQLAKAARQAPKPGFDPFTGEMLIESANRIVKALAPIIAAALTEAERRGGEKMREMAMGVCANIIADETFPNSGQGVKAARMVIEDMPYPYPAEAEEKEVGQ